MNLKKSIVPIFLAFVVYVVFSGSLSIYDISTGIVVAIVAGLLFSEILVKNVSKSLSLMRLGHLIRYAFYYFFVAEVQAHLDVIKRILNPKMPINPGIVRVPYEVSSDYAIVGVAGSIINTPGTVVIDIDEEKKLYYVHWIDVSTQEPGKCRQAICESFEKYLTKVFD
ncbi:MAG: multicomponent Na+:H+ antiporter subunit [Thermoproteota archaeon]|nr:multicomponent Na+:H+ antiporter subunit [Thermoproteota archaeon]